MCTGAPRLVRLGLGLGLGLGLATHTHTCTLLLPLHVGEPPQGTSHLCMQHTRAHARTCARASARMHSCSERCACLPSAARSQVEYDDLGGRKSVQVWNVRGPEFITQDWRTEDRFRAQLLPSLSKTNTLEKMLFHVALCTDFADECVYGGAERFLAILTF